MDSPAKTVNERKREERKRKHEAGLVRKEVWIRPEHKAALKAFEKESQESAPEAGLADDTPG